MRFSRPKVVDDTRKKKIIYFFLKKRTVGSISPAVDAVRSKGRQDFSLHHFSKLTLMMIRPGRQNLLAIDRRGYKIQSDGDHHSLSDKKKKKSNSTQPICKFFWTPSKTLWYGSPPARVPSVRTTQPMTALYSSSSLLIHPVPLFFFLKASLVSSVRKINDIITMYRIVSNRNDPRSFSPGFQSKNEEGAF